jgi:hypothetical protein
MLLGAASMDCFELALYFARKRSRTKIQRNPPSSILSGEI